MLRDNLLNRSSGPSWRDLAMSVIYLYEQGAHMPLIHNSPDPERHKKPMWRGWQLAELRPSRQESLEHLRNGGLGEVHIMDVVGTNRERRPRGTSGWPAGAASGMRVSATTR